MKKDCNLSISDTHITTLSADAINAYLALESIYYASNVKEILFSPDTLYYYFYKKTSLSKSHTKTMKNVLCELSNNKIITPYDSRRYILRPEVFDCNDGYFRQISLDNYNKLRIHSNELKHLLFIIKSRNHNIEVNGVNGIICTMPVTYFADQESISEQTVYRYNKTLEELNIIYIRRFSYNSKADNRDTNAYSLYEHRGLLDIYAGYYNKDNNNKSNFRRKVSAQYNRFVNDPNCYTREQIEQLLADVKQYNKEMEELGKAQPDYLKRIKSLNIFDGYLT